MVAGRPRGDEGIGGGARKHGIHRRGGGADRRQRRLPALRADRGVGVYADDPEDPNAGVINVAYYLASPASDAQGRIDPVEVSEIEWFAWDELPAELAPPGTLAAVLALARSPERNRPR